MLTPARRKKLLTTANYTVLILMALVALFPIYFMVIASFKNTEDLFRNGIQMVFEFGNLTAANYEYTLTTKDGIYLQWYWNSIIVLVASTMCSLGLSSICGYAIGAYDFKGKNFLFVLTMIVMMIPIEILLIPLYKMIINMQLIDTKTGSILPFVVQPTAMFFFQQYVRGIDRGYMEAARVDGCTEFGIFARIMVPMMKPAFGAMIILLALRNWNAFLWPMIVFGIADQLLRQQLRYAHSRCGACIRPAGHHLPDESEPVRGGPHGRRHQGIREGKE